MEQMFCGSYLLINIAEICVGRIEAVRSLNRALGASNALNQITDIKSRMSHPTHICDCHEKETSVYLYCYTE